MLNPSQDFSWFFRSKLLVCISVSVLGHLDDSNVPKSMVWFLSSSNPLRTVILTVAHVCHSCDCNPGSYSLTVLMPVPSARSSAHCFHHSPGALCCIPRDSLGLLTARTSFCSLWGAHHGRLCHVKGLWALATPQEACGDGDYGTDNSLPVI